MVGGIFPPRTLPNDVVISKPYIQDDLTWCVQKAKFYPIDLNIFLFESGESWILYTFGVFFGIGIVVYFFMQFDLEYQFLRQCDWHYATYLVSLPICIGVNQRFQPKHSALRLFCFFMIMINFVAWQMKCFKAIRYIQLPVERPQISTVTELIDNDFRLAGTDQVQDVITFDERVNSLIK